MASGGEKLELQVKKHSAFWLRHLRLLPTAYTSGDVQRMTLAYFCLGALDLLGLVDGKLDIEERREYIDWIYDQQMKDIDGGGFRSSPFAPTSVAKSNLAMTYTAILNLAILRDDLIRLDRRAVLSQLRSLQQPDGSFAPSVGQAEYDCRFVYCAFAISDMLDDWSAVDVDAAVGFLMESRSYDGGFGQGPNQESHGGSTYCALAALSLCGRLSALPERSKLQRWLVSRQQTSQGGFNGRTEKPEDACYSFWCGASAHILGIHDLLSTSHDVHWLLTCQTNVGGISKTPDDLPDVMHSYLALAALSMHAQKGVEGLEGRLQPIDPRLNLCLASLLSVFTMEHASANSPTCKPHHSALEASLSLFLCFGLIVSYLPQIVRIIVKKSSLGFSPYFLFLGATSSASSFLNVVSLQWAVITCCQWLSTGACAESLLGIVQVGLQWLLFMVVFVLFLIYYPRELRYERAIALTGPSRLLSDQDVADGYESDSSADLDSLDSHIAENYSSMDVGAGQEGQSGLSTGEESPGASALASRLLAEEEDERSSSAFSRLVPTFWPVWKAPRKASPLAAGEGNYAGEQLPANATSQARDAAAGQGAQQYEQQEGLLPDSVSRQDHLGVPRELRKKRRVKRRTKEWGLSLSLAWLVAFHFIFILLVTLLLVSSLPSSSFPAPPKEVMAMGPSSRLLVQRWAGFLGWSATILAALQYIPQIIHTSRARLVGSLSIPMMCLQVPGSVIFVYSLALRPGVNYTSLAAYVCTGVLQSVLLVLCIVWRIRQRRMGVDDYGRPLQTPLLDLGGQGRDR